MQISYRIHLSDIAPYIRYRFIICDHLINAVYIYIYICYTTRRLFFLKNRNRIFGEYSLRSSQYLAKSSGNAGDPYSSRCNEFDPTCKRMKLVNCSVISILRIKFIFYCSRNSVASVLLLLLNCVNSHSRGIIVLCVVYGTIFLKCQKGAH